MITELRSIDKNILMIGSHPQIIQSIFDFDYISGKSKPSIVGAISGQGKSARYFWGTSEIVLPIFKSIQTIPVDVAKNINLFINVSSGRRVLFSTEDTLNSLPNVIGGVIFAEQVPEQHLISLYNQSKQKSIFILGAASIGLLIPGILKLGAIGGIESRQMILNNLHQPGNIAVFSSSGGMTNEIITEVSQLHRISFALSFGGERFPILTPKEAFLEAQADQKTEAIIYFGELGGNDEADIVQLIDEKKITKPIVAYIAGKISEMFKEPPQFGHAKAMAKKGTETASSKRKILKDAGVIVPETYKEFIHAIRSLPTTVMKQENLSGILTSMEERKHALFSSTISGDKQGDVYILGEDLTTFSQGHSMAFIIGSMFLGKPLKSKVTEDFLDLILKMLVDHGPYVSGAVNTMITARAGKDLTSSLASGILTIGPRFGGAINQAADNWLQLVTQNQSPQDFVENFAKRREYISGIGHKKYSIDNPDPRVALIVQFADQLKQKKFITAAREIEKITTFKKGNLMLNVDGAMAAVLLDLLTEEEGYSEEELKELVTIEFFNSLFVASRSIGFIAHYLDQKRLDEGLFRLSDEEIATPL